MKTDLHDDDLVNVAVQVHEQGVAYHRQGKLLEAEACYLQALAACPHYPEVLNNLGILLRRRSDFVDAERYFRAALELRPDYAMAHNNLGNVLRDQSLVMEAEASYRAALRVKPEYAEAHNNLGNILFGQNLANEAQQSYRDALQFNPDMVDALANLCDLLETTNQIAELRICFAGISDAQCCSHASLAMVKAKLLRRDKKFAEAIEILNAVVSSSSILQSVKSEILAIQGDLHDRLGNYEQAFACFSQGKALATEVYVRHSISKEKHRALLTDEANNFNVDRVASWSKPMYSPCRLIFLVGFPRSGTTLLDSILRSHPAIEVVEEKPMLALTIAAFYNKQHLDPELLDQIDSNQLAELRQVYLNELAQHRVTTNNNAIVIDKMPLNIAHAGLIHRLFPEAQFILALRDPRDCVLSCFMQTFLPNDAMANFLTIEDAASFYVFIMKLWGQYESLFAFSVHKIKYEDVVSDFDKSVRSLLDFLGLPWNDGVSHYQETALKREQIRTPSYHQVVQPIYARASGRWLNYRAQLQPILETLEPWAEHFGYYIQK